MHVFAYNLKICFVYSIQTPELEGVMAKCGKMCFRTKVFVKITTYLKVELQDYCCG